MLVSERYLLEGAWYALEQAGLLLDDAVDLYDRRRTATAIGLAMHAREELGKIRILFDLRDQIVGGRALSVVEVRREIEDHLGKQTAAMLTVRVTAPHGSGLADIMQQAFLDPGSPENEDANKRLAEVIRRVRKRTPDDRREMRERGFYVDPKEDASEWSRPVLLLREEAEEHIFAAVSDYSVLKRNMEVSAQYSATRAALDQWPERPHLPDHRWPKR